MMRLFDDDPPAAVDASLSRRLADVALEQSIDLTASGLTYAVPPGLEDLAPGQRVIVPLGRGNKPVPGFVTQLHEGGVDRPAVKAGKLKMILSRDPLGIRLTPDLIDLARWMAGYYCCPIGMVLGSMLPAAVKKDTGRVVRTMVSLAKGVGRPAKLSTLQQAVLEAAARAAEAGQAWLEPRVLADEAGAKSVAPVKQLLAKGLLIATRTSSVESSFDEEVRSQQAGARDAALPLTAHQQSAVGHIVAAMDEGFCVQLLHGVTGSGKTEVYLQAIAALRQKDPQAGVIVLVPEIALTPQTVSRFLGRFDGVAVLHSGLSAAQRHQQWRRIEQGQATIVVGARSAIFAPLSRVGLILVDEEHDSSYKQDQLPRYHARDVAVRRGHLLGVPVVLGSATPSLESYWNAVHRKSYRLIDMPDRVMGLKLPRVMLVDMVAQRQERRGVHLLSAPLEHHLRQALESGAQGMLLLNRRGYANYIACPDHRCGWMLQCDYCDATMVYHKDKALPLGGLVRCHHCAAEQTLPAHCPVCARKVTVFGLGVQRVEEELLRKYADLLAPDQVLRMDSDTMRTGQDYDLSLQRFRQGHVKVLVGTQMIAKGLDFPNVRVVGVISGDTSLHMPDFRASERTFQMIAQVAGRAGRSNSSAAAMVLVQTFSPDDPAIQFAANHDYTGFAQREIAIRQESGHPPVTRMARIVTRDRDLDRSIAMARELADHLVKFNNDLGNLVRVQGPAACPVARVAEYHRQQIELTAPDAMTLQKLLTALRNARVLRSDAHTAVDVDPVDLL